MKINTKTMAVCAAVLLGSFLITGLAVGTGEKAEYTAVDAPAAQAALQGEKYIVRTYNGNIAVFYGEFQNAPAIETGIDVTKLRAMDRALLESGIKLDSYEAVIKLLEDFGS